MVQRIWRTKSLISGLGWLIVSVYAYLLNQCVIGFKLWPQVEYLYINFGGLNWQDIYQHPHAHRYILVGPVYQLSEWLNVDRHMLYSYVCLIALVLVSRMLSASIVFRAGASGGKLIWLMTLIFLLGISLFMNGRLIFALFSLVCLLHLLQVFQSASAFKNGLFFTAALVFSGVTSGVFLSVCAAAFSAVLYSFIQDLRSQRDTYTWGKYVLLGAVSVLFLPLVVQLLLKNIFYYGDVVAVAAHGTGQISLRFISTQMPSPTVEYNIKQYLLNVTWVLSSIITLAYFIYVGFWGGKQPSFRIVDQMILVAMLVLLCLSVYAYSIVSISVIFSYYLFMVMLVCFFQSWFKYAR